MKLIVLTVHILLLCNLASAVPRVAVFPFAPLIDSTYNIWKDQVKVLDYQRALHAFLISDLGQSDRISIVEISSVPRSLSEAVEAARSVQADFAIIGSYAELPSAIRGDARLVDVAMGDVPRGYQASATADRWEDLSDVARELAIQLSGLLGASSTTRNESKGRLIFEGDRTALGFEPSQLSHLVVEVNSPAPKVVLGNGTTMKRCSVRDRSLASGTQPSQFCYSADVDPGELAVHVEQRGYYGHNETLNLAAGKVYRLVVDLEHMDFQVAPDSR